MPKNIDYYNYFIPYIHNKNKILDENNCNCCCRSTLRDIRLTYLKYYCIDKNVHIDSSFSNIRLHIDINETRSEKIIQQNYINLVDTCRKDLRKIMDYYSEIFYTNFNLSYERENLRS